MFENKNISKLDLSNKNLKTFPTEIFELKNLRKLNLSNNKIKDLPKNIEELKLLETLDMSNNQISNFYSKACNLKNLKILNLNNNKIKVLPIQITNLTSLISLHLSNNLIEEFPYGFYSLYTLRELDLSKNKITKISSDIEYLSNLRKLWLNNLELEKFPSEVIKKLPDLKALYCYGNSSADEYNREQVYNTLTKIKGNSLTKLKFLEVQQEIIQEISISKMIENNKITKNKIFISYSHEDKEWLKRAKTHLTVLKNSLHLEFDIWDDQRLNIGDDWEQEITTSLNDSGIAILIISTDFLASDFINRKEIPPILENAKKNGVNILPIIVEPCLFSETKLSKFQAANSPSEPLSSLKKSDAENHLLNLAKRVKNILLEIKS